MAKVSKTGEQTAANWGRDNLHRNPGSKTLELCSLG